ncbi:YeiH family protein [Kitasatospora paranensis]|uniref:YeiH family protein n=1 Tax=Kitasatospora paranensis TaxID=258053 RepID=A0ABW2FXW8_9ACTN
MALTLRATARSVGPPGLHRNGPGLLLAAVGTAAAWGVHAVLPAVPRLTAAVVLGVAAAHLPGARPFVRGRARAGLALAGRRLMRAGIVLLGLALGGSDLLGLGWATLAMVLAVVAATFGGTLWLGRRLGLPGHQPLLVATGYSICGASAIGAVGEAAGSAEEDVAASAALVTLCGTLAIAVLPALRHPLGLDAAGFGQWVGASVHDVGQVVAAAQTAGPEALREAVVVKLLRVLMLAPLVAGVAVTSGRRASGRYPSGRRASGRRVSGPRASGRYPSGRDASRRRPPVVPLFVAGFLSAVALRSTGLVPEEMLTGAQQLRELVLAAALFGLGSAVDLPTLGRTGGRIAVLGLASWAMVGGVSYIGVLLTR